MNRGRSRQVSTTALARRAHSLCRSPSTSPASSSSSSSMSSPLDDSPPATPQTLEDQIHINYADDNIHLAKILLLRLKGIEVTDDNDPRIAEVQDEDFDYCFAPHGRLVMDPSDERALLKQQQLEVERQQERQRLARLRVVEQKWATEKRRLREEQVTMVRKQEMRQAVEEDQRRQRSGIAHEGRRQQARLFQLQPQPRLRRLANSDRDNKHTSFVYDFMIAPPVSRSPPRRQQPSSKPHPKYSFTTPTFDDSCSVTFTEVLASMQGALFPLTHEERTRRTRSPTTAKARSQSRSHSQDGHRRKTELLQILQSAPPANEDGKRFSHKGKGKALPQPRTTSIGCAECRRSPSTSSSVSSRPSSWLSFGSSASPSSIATSPSSSPSPSRRSSWFKSSVSPTSPTRRASWLSATLVSPPSPIEKERSYDSGRCRCHSGHLTAVNITECPLFFEPKEPTASTTASKPYSTSLNTIRNQRPIRTVSAPSATAALINNVSQSVTASVYQLVELAKGFQHAYVAAAMFSIAASYDGDHWEEREVVYEYDAVKGVRVVVNDPYGRARGRSAEEKKRAANGKYMKTRMMPVGSRVSPSDVAAFLDIKSCSCAANGSVSDGVDQGKDVVAVVEECIHSKSAPVASKYLDIPLGSPCTPHQQPPSTVLPRVLPYKLHFKPVPIPSRCPFRFNAFSQVQTTYPEAEPIQDYRPQNPCSGTVRGIQWRIRSVGNPVHLRLRALQNVLCQEGISWQGRGRELSMGGGRDRVVGIAYEGVGGSKLARAN